MTISAPATEPIHLMPTAADGRPRLVLRVGITGHRSLGGADIGVLDGVVGQILQTIAETARTVQADPAAQAVYAAAAPILLFVSPLAEGADRIAAKAALARGWRLATPMPFFQENYERDFPSTADEFRTMLAQARADGAVVELDGSYEPARRPEAYLEVGHFVLRHCDILIAIWDGKTAAGVGGTGDIVQNAVELGIPVLHVNCAKPHPISILIDDEREQPIRPENIAGMIGAQVREILWPDLEAEAQEMARRYFLQEQLVSPGSERDSYARGPFLATPAPPIPGTGRAFRFLLSLAGGPFPATEPQPTPPPAMPANSQFLFDHFQRADCLATAYSDIHRSHFVLIYFFGAMSLVAGFAAIAFHRSSAGAAFLCVEFVLLWWMFLLYMFDRRAKWRDRWLDYRLLAEMLREADLLALVGRSLAYRTIADHAEDLAPRARWVSLAFRAISRAAGVTGGRYDKQHLETVKTFAAEGRLTDQIRYHDKNAERSRELNSRLRLLSIGFFALTLTAVSVEIATLGNEMPGRVLLALAAGGLTALAYGIFGVRNQAEFEIVGRRSERMKSRLRRHRKKLRDIRDTGLTSITLGRELVRASEAMRHDVADWIGIFEMKEAEAG